MSTSEGRTTSTGVFPRGTTEFDRAISFTDAVFGFSATLLIANLDVPIDSDWQSVGALLSGHVGDQLISFAISFIVIANFWRENHRMIADFDALDSATIGLSILLVGLVIFIPFTTQGIGDPQLTDLPLPTALYAVNVAAVVLAALLLHTVGRKRGLTTGPPGSTLAELGPPVAVAVVFLLSIPIAYLLNPDMAKLSWLSLVLIGPVLDRIGRRR